LHFQFQLSKADGSASDLADITLPGGAHREISVLVSMNHAQDYGPNYTYIPATTQVINIPITPTGFMSCSLMINSSVESFNLQVSGWTTCTLD